MKLHPDILTDLVILYHAGEASQASRELLEAEAARDPKIAAALAAPSRVMTPLPADSVPAERKVFRKLRLRYLAISLAAAWILPLAAAMLLDRSSPGSGTPLAMALVPFLLLATVFVGAIAALAYVTRAGARALR